MQAPLLPGRQSPHRHNQGRSCLAAPRQLISRSGITPFPWPSLGMLCGRWAACACASGAYMCVGVAQDLNLQGPTCACLSFIVCAVAYMRHSLNGLRPAWLQCKPGAPGGKRLTPRARAHPQMYMRRSAYVPPKRHASYLAAVRPHVSAEGQVRVAGAWVARWDAPLGTRGPQLAQRQATGGRPRGRASRAAWQIRSIMQPQALHTPLAWANPRSQAACLGWHVRPPGGRLASQQARRLPSL